MNARDAIERSIDVGLTESPGRIVIGFSGGLDSTVLLDAARARIDDPARLLALHVDHGIHPKSADWARHCEAVGARLGVAVVVRRVYVERRARHGNAAKATEVAARAARYAVFAEMLGAGDTLWLAHHRDDQIETLLWRLLRGGGAAIAGMPRSRRVGRSTLLRPLLDIPRADLLARAAARGIEWIDDASNADTDFDRNYLRHAVLPLLRRRWPDVDARLAAAAKRFADEAAALRTALERRLGAIAVDGSLPIAALDGADALALLRRWLERNGVLGTRERALRELLRQACAAPERALCVRVSDARCVHRHRAALHVVDDALPATPQRWTLDAPLEFGGGVLVAERGAGGLRRDIGCIDVRPRRGGERLRPAGRDGSRSVKRLLHDAGVAPWLRTGYPLLYVDGILAAVPGLAVDRAFADPGDAGWRVRFDARR